MIIVLFLIVFLYSSAIGLLIFGFTKIKSYESIDFKPFPTAIRTAFTIIIPFRNEEKNLPILLESLSNLNYPTNLFEVILVESGVRTSPGATPLTRMPRAA